MADEAEARDVCARMHAGDRRHRLCRRAIQRRHRGDGGVERFARRAIEPERGRDHAGANWLRQDQYVACTRARVRQDARGIDLSADGVPELDLGILDRVAAEQRDARFLQLLETAAKDGGQHGRIGVLRKAGDRERRQRMSAHRVHVR